MTQPPQNPQGQSWQPGAENYGPGDYGPSGHAAPSVHADPAGVLATRWARFGGGILDIIIVIAIHAIIIGPSVDWNLVGDTEASGFEFVGGVGAVLGFVGGVLVTFLYYWIQHANWGQTLGKRAAGTRVVRADDGGAISWGQAAWRIGFTLLLGYALVLVTCGFGGWITLIDPAWILWDPRRQALHDKVAKTVVVKVSPAVPDPYAER